MLFETVTKLKNLIPLKIGFISAFVSVIMVLKDKKL